MAGYAERDSPDTEHGARGTVYYVYILKCSDGTYYTGYTPDPEERLKTHNQGKGAKYTRSRLPVALVYTERCSDKPAAMKREAAIKRMTREDKDRLVNAEF